MKKVILKNLFWIPLALAIFVLDRVTKILVLRHLVLDQPHPVFPFFNLWVHFNSGAAFSFLSDAGGWQVKLFGALAVVVALLVIWWLIRLPPEQKLIRVALGLVLGGIAGNLYDRIAFGSVIDFLDFYLNGIGHFATFNFADSAICIGAFLLVIGSFLRKED